MRRIILLASLALSATAQSVSTLSGSQTESAAGDAPTSGITYSSYGSTITLNTISSYTLVSGQSSATTLPSNATIIATNRNGSTSATTVQNGTTIASSTSISQTLIAGTHSGSSNAGTNTRTSSSPGPSNTTPCNGWPEFCSRKYSNVTMVAAHNSPFDIKGNVASNQALDVTTQLNDGIRMLQFQVHKPNSTSPLVLCHTSCDLLNAGTLLSYLTTVRIWLDEHPYEVLTILMGNYDVLSPQSFTGDIYASGLEHYLYTPPTVPMPLSAWPTLGEMIVTQKRLVVMLDYEADEAAIPWLLDEFANMWETPFSPTDPSFPCTQDRPPNQPRDTSLDRLYLTNHNLNIDISVAGLSLLIPAYTLLNQTNAVEGPLSVGNMTKRCEQMWNGRPPNFLLVDYYNFGSPFNGSVFQVAADANGVEYEQSRCCGTNGQTSGSARVLGKFGLEGWLAIVVLTGFLAFL